jgi:adenosine deaminase
LREHNLARMLRAGVCVTINSDDPAYFGGYMNANFIATAEALQLGRDELVEIASNGFDAAFVPDVQKQRWAQEIRDYAAGFQNR